MPEGKVHAQVRNGWVTLDGKVGYDYQRREVERIVRQALGVIGVTDTITVKPPASPLKVQEVIEDAFEREAEIDGLRINVAVPDHTAKLYGHVHSVHEATAAGRRRRPGGGGGLGARHLRVESHLVVSS